MYATSTLNHAAIRHSPLPITLLNTISMLRQYCETWLKYKRDTSVIKDMLPNGYSIEHTPRPTGKGGGVAIIHRSSLQLRKETTDTFRSFEHVACRLKTPKLSVRVVVVYRPPPSAKNGLTTAIFFDEWGRFIDSQTLISGSLSWEI